MLGVDQVDGRAGDAAHIVGAVKGSLEDVAVQGVGDRVDYGGPAGNLVG